MIVGWSIGYDANWRRDIGYGVPAYCDHPECDQEIDRGLGYVCGSEPHGGDIGCGLYFCPDHQHATPKNDTDYVCYRCRRGMLPFLPKPDHPDWIKHKLTDESWSQWRQENPEEVALMVAKLEAA